MCAQAFYYQKNHLAAQRIKQRFYVIYGYFWLRKNEEKKSQSCGSLHRVVLKAVNTVTAEH
jgi:hypothetical protein